MPGPPALRSSEAASGARPLPSVHTPGAARCSIGPGAESRDAVRSGSAAGRPLSRPCRSAIFRRTPNTANTPARASTQRVGDRGSFIAARSRPDMVNQYARRRKMKSAPSTSQPIESGTVFPQYPPFRRVGEGKIQERLHRVRVLGVRMRVVRGEDEVFVPEPLDVLPDRHLVGLDGEKAVGPEALRWLPPKLGHLVATDPVPVLVEPVEEPGCPAAVALEQPDPSPREALDA